MNCCAMSDLHGYLPENLNRCELILICGDICPADNHNIFYQKSWIDSYFIPWVMKQRCERVIIIAGNHDFYFESKKNHIDIEQASNGKLKYLNGEDAYPYKSLSGGIYNIFGTPYCKIFYNWAFMKDDEILHKYYSFIPKGLDILLCHDAPAVCSLGDIHVNNRVVDSVGNKILAQYVLNASPTYCFCGHIHTGKHELTEYEHIKFANVSLRDEKYHIVYKPMYFSIRPTP